MRKLSYTRKCLQNLTREIEQLRNQQVIGFAPRGTGVSTYSWEIGKKQELLKKADVLLAQKRLVEQGLIEILETGSVAQFRLTKNGAVKALKDRILLTHQELPPGILCLVAFDIPESVKKLRVSFRRFLIEAGFEKKQLSVWSTTKDVITDLKSLIDLLGISSWVEVFSTVKDKKRHFCIDRYKSVMMFVWIVYFSYHKLFGYHIFCPK